MQAMPGLILAMALVSVLGAGTYQVIVAIAVIITPWGLVLPMDRRN